MFKRRTASPENDRLRQQISLLREQLAGAVARESERAVRFDGWLGDAAWEIADLQGDWEIPVRLVAHGAAVAAVCVGSRAGWDPGTTLLLVDAFSGRDGLAELEIRRHATVRAVAVNVPGDHERVLCVIRPRRTAAVGGVDLRA